MIIKLCVTMVAVKRVFCSPRFRLLDSIVGCINCEEFLKPPRNSFSLNLTLANFAPRPFLSNWDFSRSTLRIMGLQYNMGLSARLIHLELQTTNKVLPT